MEEPARFETFSLLGGPLHGLGRRLGLVRGATNTVPLGLVLGLGTWIVLVALSLTEGAGGRLFSLQVIAAHVRLLLVIPLLFICEAWVDPRMNLFVGTIVRSGVMPRDARPALDSEIARMLKWKDSWVPDVVCLVVTVLWSMFGSPLTMTGSTSAFHSSAVASVMSMASRWYWFFCLPLFRVLILRWIWRMALWTHFLWRMARSDLHLVPTHPDLAGGLGYLQIVQTHFMPLVLAISALEAAAFAEEISSGRMSFEATYPGIALVLVVDLVVFIGPALIFTPRLWTCRMKGLSDFTVFASSYVSGFDRKWLGANPAPGEPLLGTPDLQSLADLANSVAVVRRMRVIPIGLDLLRDFAGVALLPMLPLLLLKYPIAELLRKFLGRMSGL